MISKLEREQIQKLLSKRRNARDYGRIHPNEKKTSNGNPLFDMTFLKKVNTIHAIRPKCDSSSLKN